MEIIEEIQDDISIYRIKGRLDSKTSQGLLDSKTSQGLEERLFQTISDGSKRMIVDFKDLNYISSDGIRVILIATKAIKREEGQIMFCCMRDYVKEVFEIAGLGSLLPVVATMDDALKVFSLN